MADKANTERPLSVDEMPFLLFLYTHCSYGQAYT